MRIKETRRLLSFDVLDADRVSEPWGMILSGVSVLVILKIGLVIEIRSPTLSIIKALVIVAIHDGRTRISSTW